VINDPRQAEPGERGGANRVQGFCLQDAAAEITCASMRADELRGCLVREIFRAAAIGMQAQAALLDGDDDLALDNLRRHWIVMRADIAPLAGELAALRRAGAPP
jgi:hypothetical protein